MNDARRQRVADLFCEAADLDPAAREAFLEHACSGDDELRHEVESLLVHDTEDEDVFSDGKLVLRRDLLARVAQASVSEGEPFTDAVLDAQTPTKVGPFRVIEKIGEGGMGTVYLAEQEHPRRHVALKMIRHGALSSGLMRRFRFETDVLGRLQHTGIAQIYEAGEIDSDAGRLPYFAMEYVDGVELREYARKHNLEVRAKLELFARICDAVNHAHLKGIVHRDLKPDNVLVVEQEATTGIGSSEFTHLGQPKILDFGVARATDSDIQMTTLHTHVGQLVGTITYMSPEQVIGDSRVLDTRSDIYALGVILYELLADRPPFDLRRRSIPDAARIIREEEPTRLSLINRMFRGDVDTIVGKILEKECDRRYQSAAEVAADIRRYLSSEPVTARRPTTFYQVRKFAKRHKGFVTGLALAFVILIAGTVFSVQFGLQAERGEKRARESENLSKRTTHRLSITAAASLGNDDPVRALRLLDGVPVELRNWEWHHLHARFNAHVSDWVGERCGGRAAVLARRGDGVLITALLREDHVDLVNVTSGTVLSTFQVTGRLDSPNLSPDGSCLAAIESDQKKLIVWDTETQSRILELRIEFGPISHTCFSGDSSLLAISSRETGSTVIETRTGRVLFQSAPKITDVLLAAFDIAGSRIVLYSRSDSGVSWNQIHSHSLTGDSLVGKPLRDGCSALAFNSDGTLLAVGQDQRMIRLLDATTFEELQVLYGHSADLTGLVFSPDGKHLASSAHDGSIRVWDISTGQVDSVLAGLSSDCPAESLVFSADGSVLAAGNCAGVRFWRLNQGASRILRGHANYVYRVTFSPDPYTPRLIASSSHFGEARIWDALTGEPLAEIPAAAPHEFLSFSPDGSRLIVGDRTNSDRQHEAMILDTAAGLEVGYPRMLSDEVFFESPFRPFCAAAGGAKGGKTVGEDSTSSLDGTLLAKILHSGEISITNRDTGKTIINIPKHAAAVLAVAFNPLATRIVTGDSNGTVRVLDIASGTELANMRGHQGAIYSVNFNPDGTRIVSGGNDCSLILWDAQTFEQVLVLRGHTNYVHSVCFSPDGTMLASGSGDETVRLWDSVTPAERWRQGKEAMKLRFDAEPMVGRLLKEFENPLDVADYLRRDLSLNEPLRRQALIVLLQKQRPDPCRSVAGATGDCNDNGVPDDCDLTSHASHDCNENDIPDECDISESLSVDRNANAIPDECENGPLGGHALLFNGVDDYVDLGSPTALRELGQGDFTLEMWVRTKDAARSILIGNYYYAGWPYWNLEIHSSSPAGRLRLSIHDEANEEDHFTNIAITNGVWHHVAVVRRLKPSGNIRIFIDGVSVYDQPSDVSSFTVQRKTMIARDPRLSSHYLKGMLDEVRVWDIARNEVDIAANMHTVLDIDEPGLVSYWRFEEGEGATAADLVGRNDGSLIGQPVWLPQFLCSDDSGDSIHCD